MPKQLNIENKQLELHPRLYNATIKPKMTYTVETRPDTSKTQRILEINRNKNTKKNRGNTLGDRIRNYEITTCKVKRINEWILNRREWNNRISRMTDDEVVKITNKSQSGRTVDRQRIKWSDNI